MGRLPVGNAVAAWGRQHAPALAASDDVTRINAFFTGLEGAPRDTLRPQIQQYLDANPQVKDELAGIRQPLVDLKNRCGGDDSVEVPTP